MGGTRNAKCWWENLKERDEKEAVSIYGNIILKYILQEWDMDRAEWIQLAQYWD
jgi:hypothetical protein